MKFNFYLTSFIVCFLVSGAVAQKKQNVYFLKDNGRYVTERDSADFTRIVQEPDSGSVLYNVLEYYPNGNVKMLGKSSTVDPIKLEGQALSFYPNKKKKQIAIYVKGKISGVKYDYFPDGKMYRSIKFESDQLENKNNSFSASNEVFQIINDSTGKTTVTDGNGHYQVYDDDFKYIKEEGDIKNGKRNGNWKGFTRQRKMFLNEEYEDGKLLTGLRTNETGDIIKYTVKKALPAYEGGNIGFGRFLAKTIRYPKIAKDQNLQGQVIASFVIDESGNVSIVKILKSLSQETDEEVIRTFKASEKWKPGIQDGIVVPMEAMVAISFLLPNPSMGNIIIDEISWILPKNH